MSNIGKTYKCSICGSSDHTKRNHDKPITVAAVIASEPSRKCSLCSLPGHYARTCDLDRNRAYVAYLGYVQAIVREAPSLLAEHPGVRAARILGHAPTVQLSGVGVY